MKFLCPALTCALTLTCAAVAFAQTPALDVRLGLWEMTTVSQMGGDIPSLDSSQMTAAQKAQFEAAMKAAMAEHTDTSKSCITKEDLTTASFMMEENGDLKCKQVFTANTKTLLESDVTCSGDRATKGHLRIEAPAPTAMKAAMNMTTTEDGKTMKMTVSISGKWLGADCGSVK